MGIYDRDYARDEPPPGVQLRAPRSMVMTIIIINAAFFIVNWIAFSPDRNPEPPYWTDQTWIAELAGPRMDADPDAYLLSRMMASSTDSLVYPWRWWQLLSAGFAHSPFDLWHIGINMFVLWSFGSAVEPRLGKNEFLRFYLFAIVFGSIVFALHYLLVDGLHAPVMGWGASGAVTAVTLLFALYNPNATVNLMMVFPVKAWVAALMMIVINVLGAGGVYTESGANIAYDVHLAGAAFAFAYFRFGWNFGKLVPSNLQGKKLGSLFKRKPKLRVHAPDDEDSAASRYSADEDEADRILIKIKQEGIDSLTARERKIMDDYSRRMQQKHR